MTGPRSPEAVVQRQLDAYNARDLERFVSEFSDDVEVFRLPAREPLLSGRQAFASHYAENRFQLPGLHAELVHRMVLGNKVIDHERVSGVRETPYEVVAIYDVIEGRIRTVWFLAAE